MAAGVTDFTMKFLVIDTQGEQRAYQIRPPAALPLDYGRMSGGDRSAAQA